MQDAVALLALEEQEDLLAIAKEEGDADLHSTATRLIRSRLRRRADSHDTPGNSSHEDQGQGE